VIFGPISWKSSTLTATFDLSDALPSMCVKGRTHVCKAHFHLLYLAYSIIKRAQKHQDIKGNVSWQDVSRDDGNAHEEDQPSCVRDFGEVRLCTKDCSKGIE
jgi:hypothetical protein